MPDIDPEGIHHKMLEMPVNAAKMAVFHIATEGYESKYPSYAAISQDPELQSPYPTVADIDFARCVRPSNKKHYYDKGGPHFPGPPWVTMPEKFDIAKQVRPLPDEPVVMTGGGQRHEQQLLR